MLAVKTVYENGVVAWTHGNLVGCVSECEDAAERHDAYLHGTAET